MDSQFALLTLWSQGDFVTRGTFLLLRRERFPRWRGHLECDRIVDRVTLDTGRCGNNQAQPGVMSPLPEEARSTCVGFPV